MVEADDHNVFDRILDEIPHANGVVQGESSMAEVEHFLSPTPDVEGIAEGDIVELIAGPFKGEKAQVQRIDETQGPGHRRTVRGDGSDSGYRARRPDSRAGLRRALSAFFESASGGAVNKMRASVRPRFSRRPRRTRAHPTKTAERTWRRSRFRVRTR